MYLGHNNDISRLGGIYDVCTWLYSVMSSSIIVANVLDLGSRHGEGFHCFGRELGSSVVYTFVEPSPRCIPHIEKIISDNPDRLLRLIPGVLGRDAKKVSLNLFESDHDQSANLFSDRSGAYGHVVTIEIDVFSYTCVSDHIDFAKINIEGGEYELAESNFFDRIRMFVMEAHNAHVPGKTYKDLIENLQHKFDLVTYGNLQYKYCFMLGVPEGMFASRILRT